MELGHKNENPDLICKKIIIWAATRDFQQCDILTSVDLDEPVQSVAYHS